MHSSVEVVAERRVIHSIQADSVHHDTFGAKRGLWNSHEVKYTTAGQGIETMNHVERPIPALERLIALATHSTFPWTSTRGVATTKVERVHWRNYGIRQGKNGPMIGK